MPNNQDAVLKPCPFCGGPAKTMASVEAWVECKGCKAATTTRNFLETSIEEWNHRAPTPREQELEAQNKALWELVGEADRGLAAAIIAMSNLKIGDTKDDETWALFTQSMRARLAIQKAKENKQ